MTSAIVEQEPTCRDCERTIEPDALLCSSCCEHKHTQTDDDGLDRFWVWCIDCQTEVEPYDFIPERGDE